MENANSEKTNSEILSLFFGYLENKLALGEFQERIALTHWDVESVAPAMSKLVYTAVGKLSEFSRGHRSEQSLRQELAEAVRLFEPHFQNTLAERSQNRST